MMRRCNTLFKLVFPALLFTVLACTGPDEIRDNAPPTRAPGAIGAGTPAAQQAPTQAEVVRVLDGVTIEVQRDGVLYLVRYLGVSIPAATDPSDALEFNRFLAQGKSVVLVADAAVADEDNAYLRYVFIDGEMANLKLLAGGWGEVAKSPAGFEKFEEFFKAQSVARSDSRGIWSAEPPPQVDVLTPVPEPVWNPNFAAGTLPASPHTAIGPAGVCDFSNSNTPVIKGNVEKRTGGRFYHVPGGLFYFTTAVEPAQGDRWICTEAEAQALGWKRSKR